MYMKKLINSRNGHDNYTLQMHMNINMHHAIHRFVFERNLRQKNSQNISNKLLIMTQDKKTALPPLQAHDS